MFTNIQKFNCLYFEAILLTILFLFCWLYPQNIFGVAVVKDRNEAEQFSSLSGNDIFVPNIHTVLFHQKGRPLSYPVLPLGGETLLELSFDDLDENVNSYYYLVENWDALWQNQFLDVSNFLDGFRQNTLSDYQLSIGSAISYRHYRLEIPNANVAIKRSGNYLLKVFDGFTNRLVLSRRFIVFESKTDIMANVRAESRTDLRGGSHELLVDVALREERVMDVFSDISVIILPNGIWQQAVKIERPEFVRDTRLSYRQQINPYNEFRTVSLRELSANNPSIERVEIIKGITHVFLPSDRIRAGQPYTNVQDFNSLMLVDKFGAFDPNTESDYFYAHFRLQVPNPFLDGQVYVFGNLSGYAFSERNQLFYVPEAKEYRGSILLKNGFYDYQYVVSIPQTSEIDFFRLEGSYGQTENDYLILVYLRDVFSNTQTLKGFTIIKSRQ